MSCCTCDELLCLISIQSLFYLATVAFILQSLFLSLTLFLCMLRIDDQMTQPVTLGSRVLFSFFLLRGFSSHMDQISPQIQNKVLNRGSCL